MRGHALLRHPVYLGAMLDTVGVAILFDSVWALLVAVGVRASHFAIRLRASGI